MRDARGVGISQRDEAQGKFQGSGGLVELIDDFFDEFHLLGSTGDDDGVGADVGGDGDVVDEGAAFAIFRYGIFTATVRIGGEFLAGIEHISDGFGDVLGIGEAQREEADGLGHAERNAVEQTDEFAHAGDIFFDGGDDEAVGAFVGDDAVGFLQIDGRQFGNFTGRARLADEEAIDHFL